MRSFCIGVKPVNSSNTSTASRKVSDCGTRFFRTFNISSAVTKLSFIKSQKARYMVATSRSFAESTGEIVLSSVRSTSCSGEIRYCTSSEIIDFTSPIYPIRFIFARRTVSVSSCSCASLRSTRFFPVSSRTCMSCIPISSNTRYARRLKLNTSMFIIA